MAARVNVKFVIILSAAMIAVCVAGIFAYVLLLNSAEDYERLGDRAMAAEQYGEAKRQYAKAVNHDVTNLERLYKWREATENFIPETPSAFQAEYRSAYLVAIRQVAINKRTDIEAHREYLDLLYRQHRDLRGGRGGATGLVTEANTLLSYFTGSTTNEWQTLRRYPGLALVRILDGGGQLTEDERRDAEEHLVAAIEADPTDGEAVAGLVRLLDADATAARQQERLTDFRNIRTRARSLISDLLEADPTDPWGLSLGLALQIESMRDDIPVTLPEAERTRRFMEQAAGMTDQLDAATDAIASLPAETADPQLIDRLEILERVIDPESGGERLRTVLETMHDRSPEHASTLLRLGRVEGEAGNLVRAIDYLESVQDLDPLPIGIEGLFRFNAKASAPRWISEYKIRLAAETDDEAARQAAIESAEVARDEFASLVTDESAEVKFLDGIIAREKGDLPAALEAFSRFNEQRLYSDVRGLWFEGTIAQQLGENGRALERLGRLVQLNPNNIGAYLALSQVEEQRQNIPMAIRHMERVVGMAPENEAFAGRLAALQVIAGDRQAEDPVLEVLFESRRVARGNADVVGDAAAAEQILVEGLQQHNLDPRLARELARRYLNTRRLDEAQAIVRESFRRHPNDESLATLNRALESDSLVEALELLIEDSDETEVGKMKRKRAVYAQLGEAEKADQATQRLYELDPTDAESIELEFMRRLRIDDAAGAAEVAQVAEQQNADRVDGRTFQARLASREGNHTRAVELLEEAVAAWGSDADIWRLLANEQRASGRAGDAIESYQRSLEIRPDDPSTITQYLITLGQLNRLDEALEEARRLRQFAENQPAFVNLYLALEADNGGEDGLRRAIEWRRRLISERPEDDFNRRALAELYIKNQQWLEARRLIDQLREQGDSLPLIELDARWHADQGRVATPDGLRDGRELARGVFISYIVEQGPENVGADTYLSLARFMFARGDYTTALNAAAEAREWQDPETMPADRTLGNMLLQLDRRDDAAAAFRRVIEAGADDEDQNYRKRLIEVLLRQREFADAGEQIDQIEASNRDITVDLQRIDILVGTGKRDEALQSLDQLVSNYREEPIAWAKRAQVLSSDPDRMPDALADLEEALRLNPNDWRSLRLRAALYYRDGRNREAINDLRRTLAINPTLDDVLIGLMIEMVNADRSAEALDTAIAVVDRRPTDTTLMLNTAKVFTDRGIWNRASVLLKRAWDLTQSTEIGVSYIDALINSDPPQIAEADTVIARIAELGDDIDTDPTILISRGLIEMKRNRPERAASFMTRAFDELGDNPPGYVNWARNVSRMYEDSSRPMTNTEQLVRNMVPRTSGDRDKLDWLNFALARVLAADEERASDGREMLRTIASEGEAEGIRRIAYRTLGSSYYTEKEYQSAADAWKAGLDAFPDDWEMLNNYAYTLAARLDQPEQALPLAERATELQPGRAEPYDTKAKALIKLGRIEEADDALDVAESLSLSMLSRTNVLLNRTRIHLARKDCAAALRSFTDAESGVATMPQVREAVESDIEEVGQQLEAGC